MQKNQIRIIGGEWRSRQIHVIDSPGLRPTPCRVRETLFNWLQHDIPGSRCLDLFAGSGALGFEAASRGAAAVVQVEQDGSVCCALHENTQKLNARQITLVNADVFRFLATGVAEAFDVVFLDPPFGQDLAAQTCSWLEDKGWLNPEALIYVETERGSSLPAAIPANWRLLKSKTAGDVDYRLFARQ
jgi:16S rRNA (guanine966-N2)-methyltransferase